MIKWLKKILRVKSPSREELTSKYVTNLTNQYKQFYEMYELLLNQYRDLYRQYELLEQRIDLIDKEKQND